MKKHDTRKSKTRRPSVLRRLLAGAVSVACVELAGCEEPMPDFDLGDGGTSDATGRVAVHTQSTAVPPLVANLSLSVASIEAQSDREPTSAPRLVLGAPIDLDGTTPSTIENAPPATYGAVRLVALDALTVTTATGRTIVVDFVNVPPVIVRCAGPGTYLPLGEEIEMHLGFDFALVQGVLTSNGFYPPALPQTTITEPSLVAAVLTAVENGLTVTCLP